MEAHVFIEKVYSPAFLLVGLSQALHPRIWSELYAELRKSRYAGLIIPITTLPGGLVLGAGHNRWVLDWFLYLTVIGWAMTLKSAVYLLVPDLANLVILRGVEKDPRGFRFAGLVMVVFGGAMTWSAYG